MLFALTYTGDRPIQFALCERMMSRQTIKPDLWLVSDNGNHPALCTMGQTVLRHRANENPSLRENLLAGLNGLREIGVTPRDCIAIFEDDDWYSPHYLRWMTGSLFVHPLAGEGESLYYHVVRRAYWFTGNRNHASMCATGFTGAILDEVIAAVRACPDQMVDLAAWRALSSKGHVSHPGASRVHVGIKGIPGRPGVGVAHDPSVRYYTDDPDLSVLRQWVGDDADLYAPFGGKPSVV